MKLLTTLRQHWADTALGTVVIGLVINCISPIDTEAGHWLAQQAVPIVLGCLGIGGIAFLMKRKALMFASFLGCIALCSFLKEAQNKNFAYARPNKDVRIKVAHFAPQNEEAYDQLLTSLEGLHANLISVQMPLDTNYEQQLKKQLAPSHHFQKKLSYSNGVTILLFSSYPIHDVDTLLLEGAPSLAGSVWIDSVHGKVHFFSTHIAGLGETGSRQLIQENLAQISHYLETRSQARPLLTLGNIQLAAWSPEVRQFKQEVSLNDSRIDIDWSTCNEHIFYSNHLQCIDFKTLLNGMGVIGEYQFRTTTKDKDIDANKLTDTHTHNAITMF